MQEKEFENVINSVKKKLGKENVSKISDDLGTLITDNANMNKEITEKDNEIETLKQDKENLINVNGNLLQQVSVRKKDTKTEEQENKPIENKDIFDENGNFIN